MAKHKIQVSLNDDIFKKVLALKKARGYSMSEAGRIIFEKADTLGLLDVKSYVKGDKRER